MQRLKKFFRTPLGKLSVGKSVMLILSVLLFGFAIFTYVAFASLTDLGVLRLTGFPGARDYLLIFQNDAERRPTGGFISSYGVLKFRFGLPSLTFGNVYDEKLIQSGEKFPDETVMELLAGPYYPGHGFRDGNLDPDFTVSAQELMRLYRLGYPEQEFDGVIAVDFSAFASLVQAVGGVSVGENAFFGDDLFYQLEREIQNVDLHDPAQLNNRKDILRDLAKELLRKVVFSPSLYDSIAGSLLSSLTEKHILFYFTDQKLQTVAKDKNWAGWLPYAIDSDLLAVVEGNYGGMKSSRYLVRDVEYDVELAGSQTDGQPDNLKEISLSAIANLKITIQHRGDASEPISGYYKSYWRIYAPLGSRLISGRVDREYDDSWRQVWGKVIKMNPGETREISLSYELPNFVLTDGYKLKLIKQAGSATDHHRVTIKAPAGYLFEDSTSQFDIRENLAIFESMLNIDRDLTLKIIPDTAPPGLAWQEFVGSGLQMIDLRFNEPLDAESVQKAVFELKDLDYRNQQTDQVAIRNVKFIAPQNIRLSIGGVTEECREWYKLSFSGVADLYGNAIEDKKVTVVQWLKEDGSFCDPERKL